MSDITNELVETIFDKFSCIENKRIILRKAKDSDFESMLKNVWSDEDVYKWMLFEPTYNNHDAKERIKRSINFQKENFAYFIALKDTDQAIGMCGIEEKRKGHFQEIGICIGKAYQGLGYGKEVLESLLDLTFNKLNAIDFEYGYFQNNIKSKKLMNNYNFKYSRTEEFIRSWDKAKMTIDFYILTKEDYQNDATKKDKDTEFKTSSYFKNKLDIDIKFNDILSTEDTIEFDDNDFELPSNNEETKKEPQHETVETPIEEPVINNYDFKRYCSNLESMRKEIKSFSYKEGERPFMDYYVVNDLHYSKKYLDLKNEDVNAENIYTKCGQYMIIVGSGGQGKSMMMNYLLLDAISKYEMTDVVPVFIVLNEIKEDSPYIDDLIFKRIVEIETYDGYDFHIDRDKDFYPLLRKGKFLFLFDGLDEVDFKKRKDFEFQLNKFTNTYPANKYIVSSREQDGNAFGSLDKYQTIKIEPFSKEKALEMVSKLRESEDDAYVTRFSEKLDNDLYQRHTDFASNPLLLTIMLRTYKTVGEIKDNPYEFYSDAYLALSREHDANKTGWDRPYYTNASGVRLGEYLQEICFNSILDGKSSFSRTEFEDYFREAKDRIGKESETFGFDDFIEDMTNSLCIITYEEGKYSFIHPAFQEFFCVRCIENLKAHTRRI